MKLVGLYAGIGAHPAGWRMPDAVPGADVDFQCYVRMVQLAERGKMDCVIFPDSAAAPGSATLGPERAESESSAGGVQLEPVETIPALAMLTEHIGLIGTTSTAHGAPYHVARRYATLDHISKGRAGWHLVTGQTDDEARNFGHVPAAEPALRYARAAEFYDICVGLWDSWDPGAVLRDKASGRYYDPAKVHVLNHKGRFFSVRGPLNVARSPQRYPVIVQSDPSDEGCELASHTADMLIASPAGLDQARALAQSARRRHNRGAARDPLKVLARVMPIVGHSDEEAHQRYARLRSLGHNGDDAAAAPYVVCGCPATVADTLQAWFEAEAVDGFAIAPPYLLKPFEELVELVIPELQRRGLFRDRYDAATLRGHLDLRMPDEGASWGTLR